MDAKILNECKITEADLNFSSNLEEAEAARMAAEKELQKADKAAEDARVAAKNTEFFRKMREAEEEKKRQEAEEEARLPPEVRAAKRAQAAAAGLHDQSKTAHYGKLGSTFAMGRGALQGRGRGRGPGGGSRRRQRGGGRGHGR